MYTKILWKIESLSEEFRLPFVKKKYNIDSLYSNGVSLLNSDFSLVDEFDASKGGISFSDDYGEYKGLKSSQLQILPQGPVYLFDNHNKILHSIFEYHHLLQNDFDVVHIDAHRDDALFGGAKKMDFSLDDSEKSIAETRISNFFDYLSLWPAFLELHRYTSSASYDNFILPKNPYILSLDIDIFGKEGDFVSIEKKVRIIAEAWTYADVVCIAMSPGFIDQDFAFDLVNIFTKKFSS